MASKSRSDDETTVPDEVVGGSDPHRPDDYAGSAVADDRVARHGGSGGVTNPRLGPVGWARFFWRQLTSMRTALLLLLLLALAAVPGSLVPQRTSDPNGVIQYQQRDPEGFKVLDGLQLFDTYTSFWFSAIYLLLFVSLIGCIIPRTAHHLKALRAKPPATPARLSRLTGHITGTVQHDAATVADEAARMLRRGGYRVERFDTRGRFTVSAERGYLRETGNLIFHSALVGILVTVGIGGGFGYTGQKVIVQGTTFSNVLGSYDSINPGRFFAESQLEPFSIRLDDFTAIYDYDLKTGDPHPRDYAAEVSTRDRGGDWTPATIRVNDPLSIGGTQVYLLGNGYAPQLTVRDPEGNVVGEFTTPFLPQDANLTSLGVIKVPDGLSKQLGMIGFFYPQPVKLTDGAFASILPEASESSLLTLRVYTGDLGLDKGVSVNAYNLNTDDLTEIAGPDSDVASLELTAGQKVDLPNGLGSIEFTGYQRFVSLDIHHDPTQFWVLLFAALAVAGLLTSLFVPRRRIWVAATPGADGTLMELAGLARGDDPRLEAAVSEYAHLLVHRLGPTPGASTSKQTGSSAAGRE